MKITTTLRQSQKQLLAPAMQQSIETLLLPIIELNTTIDQELQNNPLLEIDEERLNAQPTSIKDELQKIIEYTNNRTQIQQEHGQDDETLEERPIQMETCLEDKLLQQLRMELTDPLEIHIGELIIGNLNEDGYLTTSCEEIAQNIGIDNVVYVEYILRIIQNFDPIGIGARDLKECLLLQVKSRCNGNSHLIYKIINHHLKNLSRHKHQDIARKLKVQVDEVKEAARIITLFEPRPARNYRPIQTNLYIKPDIYVIQDENQQFKTIINKDGIPPLRINLQYQKMLEQGHLKEEDRNFIREKLKNALYFIKSIEQRGQTVRKIAEYIVEKQKGFFEEGHRALVPLTLKDVAQAIDRNESTISRAVNGKYMDTKQGLLPLKFFFSQGIQKKNKDKDCVTSRSIKEEIKKMIKYENTCSPLSDQEIQNRFKKTGLTIARRTVSKYRQNLNILPSHLRRM